MLAATVLTAGAAIAGLTRTAEPAQPSAPTVDQIIGPARPAAGANDAVPRTPAGSVPA